MYFKNRAEAGQRLGQELQNYRYENCVVMSLTEGGVLVGQPIAQQLHCILTLLLNEQVDIPGEGDTFGSVNQEGMFTNNSAFTSAQTEAYYQEYHGYLDDQKREKFQKLNRLLGDGGILDADMLRNHVVILVSDGISNAVALDSAMSFLKPLRLERLVICAPVASVAAVDRMHVAADELHVFNVTDNYLGTNHYYDENDVPGKEQIVAQLSQTILNWS